MHAPASPARTGPPATRHVVFDSPATTVTADDKNAFPPYVLHEETTTPLPLPAAPGLPVISTLPRIATARPVSDFTHHHHRGLGNIPVVNGQRQPQGGAHNSRPAHAPHYPPTVVHLASGPHLAMATPAMLTPSPPFFEYMEQCRYTAGFMLCYYLCTFFFLQPFVVGVLGLLTGFLGYYGSRTPLYAAHVKWVHGYVWMNGVMVVMNAWYLVISLLYLSTESQTKSASSTSAYQFDEQHLGLFIGVIVALNTILHVRGARTARRFHGEMLRAGASLHGTGPVIMLGNPA